MMKGEVRVRIAMREAGKEMHLIHKGTENYIL
jgi:hypothetical protein